MKGGADVDGDGDGVLGRELGINECVSMFTLACRQPFLRELLYEKWT